MDGLICSKLIRMFSLVTTLKISFDIQCHKRQQYSVLNACLVLKTIKILSKPRNMLGWQAFLWFVST